MARRAAAVAVLDTSVLLRLGLMQFLLGVAATGTYLPRWSRAIRGEFLERLYQRPAPIRQRLKDALESVPDAVLPVTPADEAQADGGCDTDDVHVLAAGIAARRLVNEDPDRWGPAEVFLVTGNLAHFNPTFAAERGIRVLGPDHFGCALLERNPAAVLRTIQREPAHRYERYLEKMRDDGMTATAAKIASLFAELG